MNIARCTASLLLIVSGHVLADDFQCTVHAGVYKPVGKTSIEGAGNRDRSIVGTNFIVERKTGRIRGGALFQNARHQIEVIRDENAAYEVLTRTRHADISLLKIERFAERWTFKYYVSWLGLLLTGACTR